MRIPSVSSQTARRIFVDVFPYELVIAGCGAIIATARYFVDDLAVQGGVAGTAAVISLLAGAAKATIAFVARRRARSIHDLEGCLHTLHAVLKAVAQTEGDQGLRVTIHVPVPVRGGHQLEQACDYVCDDHSRSKGTAGRRFSPHSGIIGECFRTGDVCNAERLNENYQEYVKELTSRWGYSPDEARRLDAGVMSWMAVPLKSPDRGVEAVVYLDSTSRKFFSETRRQLVLAACIGIALFAARRYN